MVVERTITLINTETGSIYRSRAPLHFKNAGDVTGIKGAGYHKNRYLYYFFKK